MAKILGNLGPHRWLVALQLLWFLAGCKSYKQDIMFKTDQGIESAQVANAIQQAEGNYRIQKNDLLKVEVYTNKGELLIDPNHELSKSNQGNFRENERLNPDYLVQEDGLVKLPIIGPVHLGGLTLKEAENVLEQEYSKFYKDVFTLIRYNNKRVFVLGAPGGQVIPLLNENTNLLEVLSLAGGVDKDSKAQNIRLLRGDLNDPEVFIIDLSTVEGMRMSLIPVEPYDVIYVEPVRRPVSESVRDLVPILSLITSTLALIILVVDIVNR